jgi:hypothetical protein
MPQLVRIAHYVQRPNHVALDLNRRSLNRSLGGVHDETGQAVDDRKAHLEVLAPPRICAFARGVHDEPRRAMALDVLRIEEGVITEIVTFAPDVFASFDLPLTLAVAN